MSLKKNKIVLATKNKDKIKEINKILGNCFEILTLKNFPEIIEDGKTLEENAIKKAKEIFEIAKITSIADDSGLEVDFLNGEPGVYSARFAGEGCRYEDNNKKLLKLLKNVPYKKRKAKFTTVVAIAFEDGSIKTTEGSVYGYITNEPKGTNGFGYDPVFYYPKLKKTFAQLTTKEKNKISHRAKAFKKAKKLLKTVTGNG
ncbi:MAG: non-canonical purine NTP pyrophosphatase, RdgB/HAM1 family [Elusimicrobia bacterium RIFOXYD2_FULL_34_15]|nr:MAG: non-canonical purine NTP pyrophosphatase, RdgB/HAM1 family [Elusimicrobia bacterium RIFOXYD2_FULL_34_15]